MVTDESHIRLIATSIFRENKYLFPSPYPDIPLNTGMLLNALNEAGIRIKEEQLPAFMDEIELELASLVPLNWSNYGTIAILLNKTYPEEDLVSISYRRITKLVMDLPNFSDLSEPDEDTLDYIIYTWVSLTDTFDDFPEDEGYL